MHSAIFLGSACIYLAVAICVYIYHDLKVMMLTSGKA